MNDINEQLSELNKMSRKSVALYHRFARSIGISDSALGLLYALQEAGEPCSQNDMCSERSVPKQTVNTAAGALQRKGLISLAPVAGTRNKKNISLTEKGRLFSEKAVGILRDAELSALSEMSPRERELYVRLNRKYNRSLTEKINGLLEKQDNESSERN